MLHSARSSEERKRLGIYYTPPEIARELATWAIRDKRDVVLEPSFGGCNFLTAAADRLAALGSVAPREQICGVDLDGEAWRALLDRFPRLDPTGRFLNTDFLTVDPSDFATPKFDAVIGNPPYVPHHALSGQQKSTAWSCVSKSDWQLPRTASLWAYFVLHSLAFCRRGARIAFVLPPALLRSNYAQAVHAALGRAFSSVLITELTERVFADQGTDERSILLRADGFRDLSLIGANRPCVVGSPSFFANTAEADVYNSITSSSVALADCARIRIGIVTGANKTFLLAADTAEQYALPDDVLVPALTKSALASGLDYTVDDHVLAVTAGARCYLLSAPITPLRLQHDNVRRYLEAAGLPGTNRTFTKRQFWFGLEDVAAPDAFLSYMHHDAPMFALNSARAVCANNIHRLWWLAHVTARDQKLAAVSFLSSYTQLSAELEGRCYGGGVLKHEVREAGRLRLLLPKAVTPDEADVLFRSINSALRDGHRDVATDLADNAILRQFGSPRDVAHMKNSLRTTLAAARRRRRLG
jgi:hypothetical protein